ncbi:hypothetical protein NDU88_011962 [Pleurodeles waltl]|uniref:Uncharacterized protein n=1 Tax=Pleurodeles waltl TaxID=8319 RepID=A0AAV7QYU5_PLEWA|nr:hypothetical protein NDU88_011962 [Pleurodeles waltl]
MLAWSGPGTLIISGSKRQAPNAQQPSSAPTSTTLPAQSPTADTLAVAVCATPEVPPVEQRTVPAPELGVLAILTDIRKSLSTLAAPPSVPAVQKTPVQAAVPIVPLPALQEQGSSTAQVPMQDATSQALLAVAQLLANIATSATPAPPTTPWATNDTLKNSVADLKHQVEATAAPRSATSAPSGSAGLSVTPAPGVQPLTPFSIDKSKITERNNNTSGGGTMAAGAGQDMLLSRQGKLGTHVGSEVKEKIWKGEFVDIFSLNRAKRREIEVKDKEGKASSYSDKKKKKS